MLLSKLTRKLSTVWQMSWSDRLLLLQTFLLLPVISLALMRIGLQPTQRYLVRLSPHAALDASSRQDFSERLIAARRTAYLVNRAADYLFPGGNCLKRSLTLWFLLRLRGSISELRIGVRRQNGEFQAHAWVEYGGQILNDLATVHQHYSAFENRFEVSL